MGDVTVVLFMTLVHLVEVQQREAMLRIMEENMEERAIKEEQKMKQQEMEIEGMREYNRILDQQEQARAEALESRINLS